MEQVIVGADGGGSGGSVKASGSAIMQHLFNSLIQSSSRSTQVEPDLRTSPQPAFTVGPERLRCCVPVNSRQVRFP